MEKLIVSEERMNSRELTPQKLYDELCKKMAPDTPIKILMRLGTLEYSFEPVDQR